MDQYVVGECRTCGATFELKAADNYRLIIEQAHSVLKGNHGFDGLVRIFTKPKRRIA